MRAPREAASPSRGHCTYTTMGMPLQMNGSWIDGSSVELFASFCCRFKSVRPALSSCGAVGPDDVAHLKRSAAVAWPQVSMASLAACSRPRRNQHLGPRFASAPHSHCPRLPLCPIQCPDRDPPHPVSGIPRARFSSCHPGGCM